MTERLNCMIMKKFEYYTIHLRSEENAVQVLDSYGEDGWEAFHVLPNGDWKAIYLKREKL